MRDLASLFCSEVRTHWCFFFGGEFERSGSLSCLEANPGVTGLSKLVLLLLRSGCSGVLRFLRVVIFGSARDDTMDAALPQASDF